MEMEWNNLLYYGELINSFLYIQFNFFILIAFGFNSNISGNTEEWLVSVKFNFFVIEVWSLWY